MMEKYDGVRVFWDGKELTSKYGKVSTIPQWIKNSLPSIAFEGVLWYVLL